MWGNLDGNVLVIVTIQFRVSRDENVKKSDTRVFAELVEHDGGYLVGYRV